MVDLKANNVQRVKRNNASLVIIIFVIFILERKIQKAQVFVYAQILRRFPCGCVIFVK